jgi:dTDP-4-amino-4,6-dideoxygalactose transaminase
MDALQSCVLTTKLRRLDGWNSARRKAMDLYTRSLSHEHARYVTIERGVSSSYHQNVVLVSERDPVRERLQQDGVQTAIHYPVPCHMQEPYRRFALEPLPVAEATADMVLSLPLFPHITAEQISYVCQRLHSCLDDLTGVRAQPAYG